MIELTDELRASITTHLARHTLRVVAPDERKRAAVAIVIVDSEPGSDPDDPHIDTSADEAMVVPGDTTGFGNHVVGVAGGAAFLICRRASRLNSHAAQWALPGGRVDPDESPEQAALRELDEELGVRLDPAAVLGRLDDYGTRSGYVITPVVVWGGTGLVLRPNPDEVAHAYRVGLHELCRDDSPRFVDIPESDRPVVQLPIGRVLIHAPTGAVLLQFRWVALEGRVDERVDELEQPVFAWR
ncbi:MAG: CoA pyrophosphatase [Actinobacteria bacterium]|nr:CoA pyrophosphatase [Actinomycetota bacterium]